MRQLIAAVLAVCLAIAAQAGPDFQRNIPLWNAGQVPGAKGDGPLDAPFLTVFTPRPGAANGSAVLIAPGGGNIMLMYGVEGADIAEVFNDWGTTAFVLTYRLSPAYDNDARTADGERAMRFLRAHAAEWKLDPKKIGLIGFSAGGSLARAVVAAADGGDAASADPIERASSRPDWAGLVYGAGRASEGESLKDFPPTFLLSAAADQGPSLANAQLFMDLTKAGAVAELHVYQRGRHGFGSGVGSSEFADWMPRLQGFLRGSGFLPKAGAAAAPTTRAAVAPPKTVNDGYGEYVYVPAGTFKMGDDTNTGWARERPAHVVDLDAYFIARFEVTNREWKKFRDDAGYDDPKFWPRGRVMPRDQIPYWTQANNHGGGTPGSDDYPVIGVNWDAATAYCAWLSAKTGQRYRLPTEAEWEKAAQGSDLQRANLVYSQPYDTVMPVGSFDGNASVYGAYDMAGNVMEWTQDWYDRDYYSVSPRKNPTGPATGAYRVVRGGSFFVEAFDLRSSARAMAWPSFQAYRMIGFRPVREALASPPTRVDATEPRPIRVLIVDGFSNHDWRLTTRSIRAILAPTGLFSVDVSTSPPDAASPGWDQWRPDFSAYDVVIQTCNDINGGPSWPAPVREAFEKYLRRGGGAYVWHSGNNAFPDWPAYNEIIGIGWRKKDFGWALMVGDDGRISKIPPGQGEDTGHGKRFDALIQRRGEHPIHAGLPRAWRAADIEVYYHVRGPAKKVDVLSYAHEPHTRLNWPIEWTVGYGRGRVYTSTLGHVWRGDVQPVTVRDAGVQTLLVRALQWLARRPVTWPVPADFPTATATSIRGELALPPTAD